MCTAFSPSRSKSVCRGLPGRTFAFAFSFALTAGATSLTQPCKEAAKKLKAKERQMTRLRKHLQKLKPSDLAELVTLVPAVKAKAKAKAKTRA